MSENKNAPQEIDLLELFSKMGKWIGTLFHKVFYGFTFFILRNILLFMLASVVGIVIAIIVHKGGQKYFKCELIGYSYTIENAEVIQFVNNWDYMKSFDASDRKLIKDIKGTYLLDYNKDGKWDEIEESDDEMVTDTSILNKRLFGNFCVQLQLYDTAVIADVSKKLFEYIGQNRRVKEMNEIRLIQKNLLIPIMDKELADLDSLKKAQYYEGLKKQGETGGLFVLNEKEVKLFHDDILKLYEKKLKIERELYLFPEPFEIIQDFTVPREAANSLFALIKDWQVITFSVGFFVILIYDQRRKLLNLIKRAKEIKD